MSQHFDIGPSFDFMSKNRKIFFFFHDFFSLDFMK